MKQLILLLTLLISTVSIAHADSSEIIKVLENYSNEDLSDEEIEGILFSIEEEKLARDLYNFLYDKWEMKIFSNIASSEQSHIEVMQFLVERYGLENPLKENAGEFTNEELSILYDLLIEKGSNSLIDALEVGTIIEDMDIADLKKQINQTNNTDLKIAYQNLMKASRNHMRSFSMQLEKQEVEYSPEYISLVEYNQIISSEKEKRVLYGPKGELLKECEHNEEEKGKNNSQHEKGHGNGNGNGKMHYQNQINENLNEIASPNFFQKIWRGIFGWF